MAEAISAEILGFITFIVMGIVFVIWLTGQLQEFAFYFGLRLSDVVSGDMSGLVTSSGGVPGAVRLAYTIPKSPGASATKAGYYFRFADGLMCANSTYSAEIGTTDCYPIPSFRYGGTSRESGSNENDIVFEIDKTAAGYAGGSFSKAGIDMVCKSGCNV